MATPRRREFQNLSLKDIFKKLYKNNPATIDWCRSNGLLAAGCLCKKCDVECTEGTLALSPDGSTWRCPSCRRRYNIRKGSLFEHSTLQLWQLLSITYFWSIECGRPWGLTVNQLMHEMEIGDPCTVLHWKQSCREVCVTYFLKHPEKIGGQGRVVEIEDNMSSNREYSHGGILSKQLVLGGYDPVGKKGFLVPVPVKDAATLLPIVKHWVFPGTTVQSDMWQAYRQLDNVDHPNQTVKHTLTFVDPVNDAATNDQDELWRKVKIELLEEHGSTIEEEILDLLAEFMWSQKFGRSPFFNFWNQVATELYIV